MTLKIKAKPTKFKGRLFRSRTEARWAVFFEKLGLNWSFEVEGYDLPDGTSYLPDFLLKTPQGKDLFIEVKPAGQADDPKFSKFEEALDYTRRAVLVGGTPLEWFEAGGHFCPRCGQPLLDYQQPWDEFFCDHCDWETPCGGGHEERHDGITLVPYRPHKGSIVLTSDEKALQFKNRIRSCAEAAQMAQFEHGATGQ